MNKSSVQYLVWLTQLGFSLVAPPILCIWGAIWAQNRYGLGTWIMVVAIVFGLCASFSNGLVFYRMMERKSKKQEKPRFFNNHD